MVYVDNILVSGDYHQKIVELKFYVAKKFKIKDLSLWFFLVYRLQDQSKGFLFFSFLLTLQQKYIQDLLKTCLLGCKPTNN